MFRTSLALLAILPLLPVVAQDAVSRLQPVAAAKPEVTIPGLAPLKPAATPAPAANAFAPTWETQKGARTYMLGIPAPRGQIVDRNGLPLAQNRVSYNLALSFPTPSAFFKNPES